MNEDGTQEGYVIYDAYGQVVENTLPEGLTDRLFTGQIYDATIGLYFYNARYYDPLVGQFTQPDSLVADPMNPAAWNRFSYVYGNPSNLVDPSGNIAWVPLLIYGGAFLLGAGAGGYYAHHQGYSYYTWQFYAYAGMGGLAGLTGAATGLWIESALLPVGATPLQAFFAGGAGGFTAGVVEQSILEVTSARLFGTEVSARRILGAGVVGGLTGGIFAAGSRALAIPSPTLDDVARARRQLGLPARSTSPDDGYTVAVLSADGRRFIGRNAHGKSITYRVNAISKTHAESDVLEQLVRARSGIKGGTAIMVVDRPPCLACGLFGGIRSGVRAAGLKRLTVIHPKGTTIIKP